MILNTLKSYELRTYFLVCFTIVGLVTSRAMMSIGVIAMFVNILLQFVLTPKAIKTFFSAYWNNKKLFTLSFLFIASIIALTYSSNKNVGFNFVVNKLPLFVIPFAISSLKEFTKKQYHFLLSFFVLSIFISSLFVLIIYFQDYTSINNNIKQGKAIWVPFNHIRYNIMLVFSFITSIYLFLKVDFSKKILSYLNPKFVKYTFAFLALFFFILIHFLSVRSGLLVLYLCIIAFILYYTLLTKKYIYLFGGVALLLAMPFLAYQNIESFRNKVEYMKYDWQQYGKGNYGSNSDSRRVVSYKAGVQLVKENMPLGVGTGSIQDEMNLYYDQHHPDMLARNRIAPHNQFLFTLIDYGILGFFALLITLFYPLLSIQKKKENIYFILFWVVACTPLLFDISLEMQIGITFFALFSSLILKQISISESNV